MELLSFLHSLLRYLLLVALVWAFFVNLRGWLMERPILTGERMMTIVAMVLCHVQLVVGALLYVFNWKAMAEADANAMMRFFKYEHAVTMLIAIALVTMGRSLSKRAMDERTKQKRVAIFYGIGLVLILWAIPWPFREVGHGLGWL